MFELDAKLAADTFDIGDLKMSRLLLMNDANYPWFILVPRKAGLVELTDLSFVEQSEVLREINLVAQILQQDFGAEKLNIGALGNVVKQLHIHVIARFKNDAAFPKPVWGAVAAKPYELSVAQDLITKTRNKITHDTAAA